MIQRGHRRIGLISGPADSSTGRERLKGYRDAHARAGIPVEAELVRFGDYKEESGRKLAEELLGHADRPTALFVSNGLMTIGALEAIYARGLRIPKQIAIIGFDELPLASVFNPPLTVVRQPAYEVGKCAAELLLKRLEEPNRPASSLKLLPNLIIRKSCWSAPGRTGQIPQVRLDRGRCESKRLLDCSAPSGKLPGPAGILYPRPMPSSYKVVVVGSIMQDLAFACDHFPTRGQTVVARLSVGQGGKGSNQAIACGRAGARTIFVGAVGQDSFAGVVRRSYREERIGHKLVTKAGCATGTAVILVNQAGENEIVIEPGANARLAPGDVSVRLLRGASVVLTQLEANLMTTAHVLRTCHKLGVATVLNPAPMRADFDPAMLRHVNILIPNETEFAALVNLLRLPRGRNFGEKQLHALSPDALHALCRQFGVPIVIVTLGSKGCFVSQPDGHLSIPAYSGIKVADTTGAGDDD